MAGKPVIWLKEGHVCGFTLPLPPNVEKRWKAGELVRVNKDGSTYQGAHYELPDVPLEPHEPPEDDDGPGTPAPAPAPAPQRPKPTASKTAWALYAVLLGACSVDDADAMTRDQLIDLTTPPEEKASVIE
jgi:hypothetical protein